MSRQGAAHWRGAAHHATMPQSAASLRGKEDSTDREGGHKRGVKHSGAPFPYTQPATANASYGMCNPAASCFIQLVGPCMLSALQCEGC
jgi:hypothetical protein